MLNNIPLLTIHLSESGYLDFLVIVSDVTINMDMSDQYSISQH